MKNFSKNIILWIVIGLLLIALFNLFQNNSSSNRTAEISFSDFLIATDNGNISEVKIVGNSVSGFFDDGRQFSTYSPNYPELVNKYLGGKLPETMDELISMANKVKADSGGEIAGAAMRGLRTDTNIDTISGLVFNAWGSRNIEGPYGCLLYTSPSPRDQRG